MKSLKKRGVVEKRGEETKSMPHAPVSFVSMSNYIILDESARTGTLGFLRMDYLQ
jgi:hypothetical protein